VPDQICLFQVIMAAYKSEPLLVLEENFLPASQCSLEVAKVEFMRRYEDRSYSRKHSVLWPDAVRFLDQSGHEAVRYTAWNYFREITMKERSETLEVAPAPLDSQPVETRAGHADGKALAS
jgi:hypothetical protein